MQEGAMDAHPHTSPCTRSTVGGALTRARLITTDSSSPLPSASDISNYRSLLFNLTINVIPKRKKTVKGRFDKYETARRDFISYVALPNLVFGSFLPTRMTVCFSWIGMVATHPRARQPLVQTFVGQICERLGVH